MTSTRKANGKKRRSAISHVRESEAQPKVVTNSESILDVEQPSTCNIRRGQKRALSSPARAPNPKRMIQLQESYQHEDGSYPYQSSNETYGDENEEWWAEPSGSCSVENPLFRSVAKELDDEKLSCIDAPLQLTSSSTNGLGSPSKVWNLMVRTDEIVGPSEAVLRKHRDIKPNMRAVLIDWMMEVCETEKQHRETFHLAVDYVDRYLESSDHVPLDQFQLIGTTALFIASKYEEIYPPKLDDFVQYTDNACSDIDVRKMEIVMLKCLQWTLSPVTSLHWLGAFMQLLGKKEIPKLPGTQHITDHPCVVPDFMRDDFVHMAKILDMCLLDIGTLRFSYREIAAAVIFSCLEPQQLITQITGFTYDRILPAIEWVEPFMRFCEKKRAAGDPLPQLDGVNADDVHNIQTHGLYDAVDEATIAIERDRKELRHKRMEMRAAGKRAVLKARMRV